MTRGGSERRQNKFEETDSIREKPCLGCSGYERRAPGQPRPGGAASWSAAAAGQKNRFPDQGRFPFLRSSRDRSSFTLRPSTAKDKGMKLDILELLLLQLVLIELRRLKGNFTFQQI